MKKKTLEDTKKTKETQEFNTLPPQADMILVQHPDGSIRLNQFRHFHYCASCGTIIRCYYKDCNETTMHCPDCEKSNSK